MDDPAPRLYKMMGSLMGAGVVVVALFADWWPYSLVGFVMVALAIVGIMITHELQLNHTLRRRELIELVARADSQHAAILAGGDKLAWGFYGKFLPKDDWNVFSDRWEAAIAPPEPESEHDFQRCSCEDCANARWWSRRNSVHDYQRCHCPDCADKREATAKRPRPNRLRVPD